MSDNLTPVDVCLAVFGGRLAVERIAGGKPKCSYAWERASRQRQAGDLPPYIQRKMLREAKRLRIDLPPLYLIEGATRNQVEALLTRQVAAE